MPLVYDREGAGLPTYVPARRTRPPLPSASERVMPLITSLGAGFTFRRFLALVAGIQAFSEADVALAQNCWAIGFHEGARAALRSTGRELPPFEEAYLTVDQLAAQRGEAG